MIQAKDTDLCLRARSCLAHPHDANIKELLHVQKQCELLAALQGTTTAFTNLTFHISVQGFQWGMLLVWAS